jgi:hypothetical protein
MIMNYLQAIKEDIAKISANKTQTIKWYVDSLFAIHKGMKSHIIAIMTLDNGAIIFDSSNQKVNIRSSTKSGCSKGHYFTSALDQMFYQSLRLQSECKHCISRQHKCNEIEIKW